MAKNTPPLIPSSFALKTMATAVTLLSASGMTAFAATHLQNGSAPLKPAALDTTGVSVNAIPTPTAAARSRRTTITPSIGTTTTTPVTKTHRS